MMLTRSDTVRAARAQSHATLLAGGSAKLYDGLMPTTGEDVADQVMIAEFTLSNPAGVVDTGAFWLSVVEAMAVTDGTPTWLRLLNSAGDWLMDMDVGAAGSGAAAIISPAMIYAGGTVRITRLRLIEP